VLSMDDEELLAWRYGRDRGTRPEMERRLEDVVGRPTGVSESGCVGCRKEGVGRLSSAIPQDMRIIQWSSIVL
jgi:hypothetical protein